MKKTKGKISKSHGLYKLSIAPLQVKIRKVYQAHKEKKVYSCYHPSSLTKLKFVCFQDLIKKGLAEWKQTGYINGEVHITQKGKELLTEKLYKSEN